MDERKRKQLEASGFAVGTTADFLELAPEETALIDMRLALSRSLRERRDGIGLTQAALARRIGSSQSRVAKMEAGDPSVSLDLLIGALLAVAASRIDVGQARSIVNVGAAPLVRARRAPRVDSRSQA